MWFGLGLVGMVALGIGLWLIPDSLSFDGRRAMEGVASQLSTTLPAAVVTLLAAAANLAAGAVLLRLLVGRPFASPSELAVGGFVGAVSLDVFLLYLLAGNGLFLAVTLVIAHGLVFVAALRWARPLLAAPSRPAAPRAVRRRSVLLWAFVAIGWSGPVALQLASPVVPFMDVLPNHVAPVEHVASFATLDPLTTTPSPIYGPSRSFLGYISLLGTVTVLTGLPAALSVSSFILPQVLLVAASLRLWATRVGGAGAGFWVLVTFMLTQPFARLADDRARIVAIPLALWTLSEYVRQASAPPVAISQMPQRNLAPGDRQLLALSAALGATILMHPLIGFLTAATVVAASFALPARSWRLSLAAVCGASTLAAPQAATMLDIALAPIHGLATLPVAALVTLAVSRFVPPAFVHQRDRPMVPGTLLVGGGLAALAMPSQIPGAVLGWLGGFVSSVPILAILSFAGVIVARSASGTRLVASGAVVGLGAGTAAIAVGTGSDSVTLRAIGFEIPKAAANWTPIFLAVLAAIAIDRLLSPWSSPFSASPRRPGSVAARLALVAAVLMAMTLPIRIQPIDPLHVGEHRVSETLAINLRHAEHGFWLGYPDSRTVIGPGQQAIIDVLEREIDAGRIDDRTDILHVAASFQQWSATPIGVFTGIRESTVAMDARSSIHSAGGRLHELDQLDSLLSAGHGVFEYVVLEPDLPGWVRERIVGAGYRSVFANQDGEVFRSEL